MPDLGRRFGGRDYTTVMHAVRKFQPLIDAVNNSLDEKATVEAWARELLILHPEYSKRRKHPKSASEARAKWWAENRTAANFSKRRKISIHEARKILAKQQP